MAKEPKKEYQGGPGDTPLQDGEVVAGGEEETPPAAPPPPEPDPVADLKAQMDEMKQNLQRLQQENTQLRQGDDLRGRREAVAQEQEDKFKDFETEFYKDPTGTMRRFAQDIRQEVTQELTGRYRQEQSQKSFWDDFYRQNPDLVEDKDLVETTMNRNMAKLADLPLPEATKQIADLTRERILRYSGGKTQGQNRNQVTVEGGNPPQAEAPRQEEQKITSLSDLVRARNAKRRKAMAE